MQFINTTTWKHVVNFWITILNYRLLLVFVRLKVRNLNFLIDFYTLKIGIIEMFIIQNWKIIINIIVYLKCKEYYYYFLLVSPGDQVMIF